MMMILLLILLLSFYHVTMIDYLYNNPTYYQPVSYTHLDVYKRQVPGKLHGTMYFQHRKGDGKNDKN